LYFCFRPFVWPLSPARERGETEETTSKPRKRKQQIGRNISWLGTFSFPERTG
jgi:hypothetical protein